MVRFKRARFGCKELDDISISIRKVMIFGD